MSQLSAVSGPDEEKSKPLSLPESKSEHTDGVIRRELVSQKWLRWTEQPAEQVHPYPTINVSERHCNNLYAKAGDVVDAARRISRRGRGIHAGLSQSLVRVRATAARSDDHGFP
jgi:hypothetical protein